MFKLKSQSENQILNWFIPVYECVLILTVENMISFYIKGVPDWNLLALVSNYDYKMKIFPSVINILIVKQSF